MAGSVRLSRFRAKMLAHYLRWLGEGKPCR